MKSSLIYTNTYIMMLSHDIWQFCVIDYLEYKDQCKLIKVIDDIILTDLFNGLLIPSDVWKHSIKQYLKYPEDLIKGICGLEVTSIISIDITDDMLRQLKYVRRLALSGSCNVTDDGVKHLKRLRLLHVGKSFITDDGIKHLKLDTLFAGNVSLITDDGIRHMISLRTLFVYNNPNITDRGIELLHLTQLIALNGCGITDKGIIGKDLTYLRVDQNSVV